jgi:hypothetical protein
MSGYKGVCIYYMAYVCSARWLFFGYFPDELRRIHLLGSKVSKRVALRCLFVGDRGGGMEVDVLLPL